MAPKKNLLQFTVYGNNIIIISSSGNNNNNSFTENLRRRLLKTGRQTFCFKTVASFSRFQRCFLFFGMKVCQRLTARTQTSCPRFICLISVKAQATSRSEYLLLVTNLQKHSHQHRHGQPNDVKKSYSVSGPIGSVGDDLQFTRQSADSPQVRLVLNPLLSVRPAVTFPASLPLASTNLYCLVNRDARV